MHNLTARAAVLPFRIIESLDIGCGYERSFKLSGGRIAANRYLLGIDTNTVTPAQLLDACRQLEMPESLMDEFRDGLPGANLVFLGFEDSGPRGNIYKVYLEYWNRLRHRLRAGQAAPGEPQLLHKGFKWYIDNPGRHVVTWYHCLPGLGAMDIRQRIERIYRDLPDAAGLEAVRRIIDAARRRSPGKQFLFVEVSEPGNPRKSFDLNLYPAGMRVANVAGPVRSVAAALDVPADKLERLMSMIPNKPFGHVSGGLSRHGEEYFTVYYEN